MTAAPRSPTAPAFPMPARRLKSARIRGIELGYGCPDASLGAVRRPTRPRSPVPLNSGNTLAIKRLANECSVGQTGGVAVYLYRYYDPVTGRWASRDPIGENAGENLYGFAGNNGVTWFDFLGTQTITTPSGMPYDVGGESTDAGKAKKCICGPDVTEAIYATLEEVGKEFELLKADDRASVCSTMFRPDTWDIKEFHNGWTSSVEVKSLCGHADRDNANSCKLGVTLNGECHYAGNVNFILFGFMGKLCNDSQLKIDIAIYGWKVASNGARPWAHYHYPNARGWADAGYAGWLTENEYIKRISRPKPTGPSFDTPKPTADQLAPRGDALHCQPCNKSIGKVVLGWHIGMKVDGSYFGTTTGTR